MGCSDTKGKRSGATYRHKPICGETQKCRFCAECAKNWNRENPSNKVFSNKLKKRCRTDECMNPSRYTNGMCKECGKNLPVVMMIGKSCVPVCIVRNYQDVKYSCFQFVPIQLDSEFKKCSLYSPSYGTPTSGRIACVHCVRKYNLGHIWGLVNLRRDFCKRQDFKDLFDEHKYTLPHNFRIKPCDKNKGTASVASYGFKDTTICCKKCKQELEQMGSPVILVAIGSKKRKRPSRPENMKPDTGKRRAPLQSAAYAVPRDDGDNWSRQINFESMFMKQTTTELDLPQPTISTNHSLEEDDYWIRDDHMKTFFLT